MYFALARWQWVTEPFPHWAPPSGAIRCLDVRPIGAQATAGGIGAVSLFGYDADPSGVGVTVLGDDPQGRLSLTGKTALEDALGLTARLLTLDSQRLGPAIWEGVTRKAVPSGSSGPRPIMPDRRLRHRLIFGPLVHDIAFDLADPDLRPNVIAALKGQYRQIREYCLATFPEGDPRREQYRRVCGHWVKRKFRVSDYRQFQPDDLPDEEPLDPATTITDDFNRADDATMGNSAEGWSWTNNVDGAMQVKNNEAIASTNPATARAESALSSDDHAVQANLTAAGALGINARFDPAANSSYWSGNDDINNRDKIWKIVTGTVTELAASAGFVADAAGELFRQEVDGSGLELFRAGVSAVSTTDTTFAGQLYTGIRTTNLSDRIDDFEAADLAAGGGGTAVPKGPLGHPFHGPFAGPIGP